jgi:hypothetical protein
MEQKIRQTGIRKVQSSSSAQRERPHHTVPTISSSSLKIEDGDAVQDKTERYFPFLRVTADAGGPGG